MRTVNSVFSSVITSVFNNFADEFFIREIFVFLFYFVFLTGNETLLSPLKII